MKVNMGFQKLKSSVLSGMSELLLPDVFEGDTAAVYHIFPCPFDQAGSV